MDVIDAPTSGRIYTDSLVKGPKWAGLSLTFSFPTSAAQFTGYTDGEPFNGFEALNGVQQAAVRAILASISGFTNLVFTESVGDSASSAVLRFGMTDDMGPGEIAHAYLPNGTYEQGGDSWYNNSEGWNDNPVRGNDAWYTFMHEIGHTLGLGHPHEAVGSEPAMPADRDNMRYTVMSYETGYMDDDWDLVQTYMVEDVAALQLLYGANFNTNNTDSVYRWNASTGEMSINGVGQGAPGANRVYITLWDGGGNDTYDFSSYPADPNGYQSGLRINLTPGEGVFRLNATNGNASVLTIYNPLLYNGDTRSLIENAIGTTGWDIITGNELANHLDSNGGGELYGLGGDDTLVGGGLLFGGDGNDTLSGGGSLEGGTGNDLLTGAEGDDRLYGQDGDDTLIGGGGADRLVGGPGTNSLNGGDGNDSLEGDNQVDILIGGAGNDALYGYDGNDTMQGGAGDDTYYVEDAGDQVTEAGGDGTDTIWSTVSIVAPANVENLILSSLKYGVFLTGPAIDATGNALNNTISGNHQANVIDGGAGADTMSGGGGDDTYYVDNLDDLVYERDAQGSDTVYSSVSYVLRDSPPPPPGWDPYAGASINFWYTGPNAIELLVLTGTTGLSGTGNAAANEIRGNSGENLLNGLAGNDTLTGGLGGDELIGGSGADLFLYTSAADSVLGQRDWLSDFEHGTDLVDLRPVSVLEMAFFVLEDMSATIVTADVFSGTDMMFLVAGVTTASDFLVTFASAPGQTLVGTSGDDTLTGGSGHDTLDGGAGNDTMSGAGGDDIYLVDSSGDQVVEGSSAGYDTVFTRVSYTLGANVERLLAYDPSSTASLNFTGNALNNEISANAGANVIDGAAGADFMSGQGGNDVYFVDNAGDYVLETAGNGFDTVFATASYTLAPEVERVFAYDPASSAALNFTGNALNNELGGTAGANILDGGVGGDLMVGGDGNDIYFVDDSFDIVSDSPTGGYDTVFASISFVLETRIERVVALDPNATTPLRFTGNAVANEITGNAGSNLINGGGGADILFGAAGGDAFVFTSALGGDNIAALPDFAVGSDRLYLDDAVFTALAPGALAAGAFHTGAAAADADDRILYNSVTGALLYDADGNGAGAAIQFATLHEGMAVTASDFQVI
jgi:serralysin